ncbi:MAG: oligosaccharide flippase family protein [Rhodopila sp.]
MRPSASAVNAAEPHPAWRDLLGSGAVVGLGLAVEVVSQFARTLILARLLGASEFGLVASVNTLYAVVDMVSFIGIDRYIIFSPQGGDPEALGAAHNLSLLRGVVSAALILALALPTAALVGARDHASGFSVLAIVPLLRGATHLGIIRIQRSGCFWPAAAAEAFGSLAGLIATVAAALLTRDFTALLWGLGIQAAVAVLLSHVLSFGTAYRCSFSSGHFRAALSFGLPLMGNGLALAAAFQLDRMVIGAWLGVVELGIYGLSMAIIVQPISLLMRLANTAWQPRLSAAWHQDKSGLFPSLVAHIGRFGAALGAAGAAIAVCIGSPFVQLAFGDGYFASDTFFFIMASVILARLCRGALNLLGLAIGRTSDLMLSNLAGAIALPATIAAFFIHPRIESAALGGLIGEILSCVALTVLLRPYCAAPAIALIRDFAKATIVPFLSGATVLLTAPDLRLRVAVAVAGLLVCLGTTVLNRNTSGATKRPTC